MTVRILAFFDTAYPETWQALREARPQSRRYPALNWPSTLGTYDAAKPEQLASVAGLAAAAGIDGFVVDLAPSSEGYRSGAQALVPLCRREVFGLAFRWRNDKDTAWDDETARPQRARQLIAALAEHRSAFLDGKPMLIVENPQALGEPGGAAALLRAEAAAAGLDGFYLMASRAEAEEVLRLGFDAALDPGPAEWASCPASNHPSGLDLLEIQAGLKDSVELTDKFYPYQLFIFSRMIHRETRGKVFPRVFPAYHDWVSHPAGGATLLVNGNAEKGVDQYMFGLFVENAIAFADRHFPEGERFVFLDSWNRWLDGSQIEPSVLDGDQIYQTVKDAIDKARFMLRSKGAAKVAPLDATTLQRLREICEAAYAAAGAKP
jgi:hypothetical protein